MEDEYEEQNSAFEKGFEDDDAVSDTEVEPTPEEEDEEPVENEPIRLAEISEEEWLTMRNAVNEIGSIKSMAEAAQKGSQTVGGNYGELRREMTNLQHGLNPNGIEVTAEDFKEMEEDFPELTKMHIAGLNRWASKIKTSTQGQAPSVDQDAINDRIGKAVQDTQEANATVMLDWMEPEWREITGKEHSNTAYRQWLATQSEEYQKEMYSAWNPSQIAGSIQSFRESAEGTKPAPRQTLKPKMSRKAKLVASVTPKGSGGVVSVGGRTDVDEFHAGFTE